MKWDAIDPLQAFQDFGGLTELWLKDQKVPDTDYYINFLPLKELKYGSCSKVRIHVVIEAVYSSTSNCRLSGDDKRGKGFTFVRKGMCVVGQLQWE